MERYLESSLRTIQFRIRLESFVLVFTVYQVNIATLVIVTAIAGNKCAQGSLMRCDK